MIFLAPFLPLALSALTALAPGEVTDPEAKDHFQRGLDGYTNKEYGAAIKEFRVAYALDPQPDILFAWAQAERLYGRCSRAAKLYSRFLKSKPSEQRAGAARTGIDRCKDQPDTAQADLEDEPADETPVEAAPAPVVEEAPPPPVEHKRKVDGAGIGLLGVGVALAGAGAGLLGVGQSKARAAEEAANYAEYADDAAQVRKLRITGGVLAGVGGALIVAGIAKLILHSRETRRDVAFWANPVGAGVTVRLRF